VPARLKRGPDTCGQLFVPPRTYSPPSVITDEKGRELIPLTAREARFLRICIGASKVLRWEDLAHLVESDRAVRNAHAEFVQKSPSTEPLV